MKDPKQKLISLVRDAAERKGCTKSQVDQIIALVQATMSEGVPEMEDLERILKSIGGVDK
jgi:predicted transcriptional regulator